VLALWRYESLTLRLVLVATGVGVSIYLLRLPTRAGLAPRASGLD